MQPDITSIPQSLAQVLWLVLATFLGWIGGWLSRRKREPHEIAKISAETRQISINTDVSLIQAATTAITKAERLQQERDHWERKASDLIIDLEEVRDAEARLSNDNGQLKARLKMKQDDLDKAIGLLKIHHISFAEFDEPTEPK